MKKTQNGHAWNSVVLDGEEYYCDLTWDAHNIQMNNYPLEYCLCDGETFGHEGFIDKHKFEVEGYITEEEQLRLFGFSEDEIDELLYSTSGMDTELLEAMLKQIESREYMESFVGGVSSEVKASDFEGMEKAIEYMEKEGQIVYDK